MIRKAILALAFWLGAFPALAQNISNPAPVGAAGSYNSVAPVCTSGQWCALRTDVNGNLRTSPAGTQTVVTPNNVTPINCSGTITTGGTAQNAFTAQTTLSGFTVMNISAEPLWIAFNGTATASTAGSYLLNPSGGSYSTPSGFGMNSALSILGATTGSAFTCTRW